jgi:hypothetical protein
MIAQSINIQFTETSSVEFNRPVQQTTILDSTNTSFLRQIMLSNDGVKIIKGNYTVQFPVVQLFAAAFAAIPSMSWAPIVEGDVTASYTVYPNTASLATASLSVSASSEFNNDITYQWYVSSSQHGVGYQLPTDTSNIYFWNTSSIELSASFNGSGSFNPNPTYFFCAITNPAGITSSSVCTITASL